MKSHSSIVAPRGRVKRGRVLFRSRVAAQVRGIYCTGQRSKVKGETELAGNFCIDAAEKSGNTLQLKLTQLHGHPMIPRQIDLRG
jgi:hypothetical protein